MWHDFPVPIMLVNKSFCIVDTNGQAAMMFGYSPAELIGKPVDILVPKDNKRNHRIMSQFYLENVFPYPMAVGHDIPGLCKNGQQIPLRIVIYSYKELMLLTIIDVETTKMDMVNTVKVLNRKIELLNDKTEMLLEQAAKN